MMGLSCMQFYSYVWLEKTVSTALIFSQKYIDMMTKMVTVNFLKSKKFMTAYIK